MGFDLPWPRETLDWSESWAVWLWALVRSSSSTQGELSTGQGSHPCGSQVNKEGGGWAQFVLSQCTTWTDQRVEKQGGLSVPAWNKCAEWTLLTAQCSEGMGGKLGNCDYYSPDWALILPEPQKREKNGAKPPSACSIQEDMKNHLGGFKISRRLFFFFFFLRVRH